jgi:serine/threonine protein kinase
MSILLKQLGPFHLHEDIDAENGILVYYATDIRTRDHKLVYVLDRLAGYDEAVIQAFFEHVSAAQQLQHPNILSLDECGEIDGYHFAATQSLVGASLTHTLSQQEVSFPFETISLVLQQVAAALDFAAERGVLHGALSPGEIWLSTHGAVQVSGIGLFSMAAPPGDGSAREQAVESGLPDVSSYMAPEQLQSEYGDRRTDVYSLSAIAYTLLQRRPPFLGDQRTLRERIIHRPPPRLEELPPGMPRLVETIVQFGLAKDPSSRYATAGEFARAFAQAQEVRPAPKPLVYHNKPSVLQTLLANTGQARVRYGLLIALPLLVIALLTGTLLVSRSFTSSLPSQAATGNTPASVQQQEAQQGEADMEAPVATVVETESESSALAGSSTPPASAPATAPDGIDQPAANDPAPDPPVQPATEVAMEVSNMEVGNVEVSNMEVGNVEVDNIVDEVVAESSSSEEAGRNLTLGAEDVTATSAAQGEAPAIPLITQQLGTALYTVVGQILQSAATLPLSAPSRVEPEPVAVSEAAPPPAEPAGDPPVDPAVQPEEEPGLHLPLVLQSIYAEGTVNAAANLRAGPSTSTGIMGIARPGQRVTLVACSMNCGWYQLASGEWIAAFLVNVIVEPGQPLPLATPDPPTD